MLIMFDSIITNVAYFTIMMVGIMTFLLSTVVIGFLNPLRKLVLRRHPVVYAISKAEFSFYVCLSSFNLASVLAGTFSVDLVGVNLFTSMCMIVFTIQYAKRILHIHQTQDRYMVVPEMST